MRNFKLKNILTLFSFIFIPNIIFAASYGVVDFINRAFSILNDILIPIAFALCLMYFFWGVAKYIREEGEGKEDGRKVMLWGVIALFVAFSIWGIIRFMRSEIGLPNVNNVNPVTLPKF